MKFSLSFFCRHSSKYKIKKTNMANTTTGGKATTAKKIFSRETTISQDIQADAAIIWALLTNASDFSRWNSTVLSVDGTIAPGGKINLKSVLDPKRIFKLKIKTFEPGKLLAWGDAMGTRTYTLTKNNDGSTHFNMHEKIGGPLFPLFAPMIPPFDKNFEQFTADLKKEAETIAKAK
jgi:uncharacterized protein YndB with AHSA1/START domain